MPRPTDGARDADRIVDAITATHKRLAGLDVDRTPLVPGERPRRVPGERAAKELNARQIAGIERALQALGKAVDSAGALPAAASATITGSLRTLLAAVTGLADVFVNVPPEWAKLLGQLTRQVAELPVEPPPEPSRPDVG